MQPVAIIALLLAIVLGVGLVGLWMLLQRQTQANARLLRRVQDLEAVRPVPGVEGATPSEWTVQVGGLAIPIRALTTEQWALAMGELPQYLFTYITTKSNSKLSDEKQLTEMVGMAQRWILACATQPVALERLTIPEAMQALTTISRVNGVDAALRELLRQRLEPATPRQNGDALRTATEPATKHN
jgi:hypothetical protein